MGNENQDDKKFDDFIEWLDKEGIMLCPIFDMQEKYCSYYRNKYKDASGGFCLCGDDCRGCDEKKWNEELGLAVDEKHYQRCLEDQTKEKPLIHKGKPLETYFK